MEQPETTRGEWKNVKTISIPAAINQKPGFTKFANQLCAHLSRRIEAWEFAFNESGQLQARQKDVDHGHGGFADFHVFHCILNFLRNELRVPDVAVPPECPYTEETVPREYIDAAILSLRGRYRQLVTGDTRKFIWVPKTKTGKYREAILGVPIPWNRHKNEIIDRHVRGLALGDAQLEHRTVQLQALWQWVLEQWDEKIQKVVLQEKA